MWQQRATALERGAGGGDRACGERERARIAGELHDVVTHNVSMMVVQAGAARTVLDAAPELAREALLAVEASGRAAMVELRHVMGLLTRRWTVTTEPRRKPRASHAPGRDHGRELGPDSLAPRPGLDQLGSLVDRVRAIERAGASPDRHAGAAAGRASSWPRTGSCRRR